MLNFKTLFVSIVTIGCMIFSFQAEATSLIDFTNLSPTILNTPNSFYPYKGFVVEPEYNFVFNNIQIITKTLDGTNPFLPITFCLWKIDDAYLLDEEIECSNVTYNASDLPLVFEIKNFDFADYTLLEGQKYAFVYGPDQYSGFSSDEVEGRIGYAIMQGPDASGINKYVAWSMDGIPTVITSEASIFSLNYDSFYTSVKNTAGSGVSKIYEGPSTGSQVLKQVPEDWIVRVDHTTDEDGGLVIGGAFRWYEVTDPTDSVSGWMKGATVDGVTRYLSNDTLNQETLVENSSEYVESGERPDLIIQAIDHYFSNEDENHSLYSSDNGSNNISILSDQGFEKKIILGIAAEESGIIDFNNEKSSFDFGHGIMQITLFPHHWDNRGIGSGVKIPLCEGVISDLYLNCYTDSMGGLGLRDYKPYADNPDNPTYKQYSNTKQSFFSNIKDGMRILQQKYAGLNITSDITIGGITYNPIERESVLVTQRYNGSKCAYVKRVATRLMNIEEYFPGQDISDIEELVNKMYAAGNSNVCAMLYSPGELYIEDSKGKKVGVIKGKGINDFPMAVYDKEEKFVKIMFAEKDDYNYKVIGTSKGLYGLDIVTVNSDKEIIFSARNIPISKGEIHSYKVNTEKLSTGQKGVTLSIDKNGDGVIDKLVQASYNLLGYQI